MRKVDCDMCPNRVAGMVCDLPLETARDIRRVGVTTLYRPRQVVFGEGNPAEGLYLVCQGRLRLYQSDRFGRERVLEIADAGSVVGELPCAGDHPLPLSVSAEAVEPSQLCFLSRERLAEVIREHPDAGVRLVEALSRELSRARGKVRDLVFKDAGTRLAALVLELLEDAGATSGEARVELGQTRAELATRIGVSTETAIRLLAKLARRGVVRIDGRALIVPDVQRLERIARANELQA